MGVIAVLIVVCSVFYSGLIKPIAARDIDTRYFYVAAKCWESGHSPYDAAIYRAEYEKTFHSEPEALFVAYLPTLMPAILPLAPFDWPTAARLFAAINFSAAMLLFWASYQLVRQLLGEPLRPTHWAWLLLGATIGGVSATISTGQTSLLAAAACAVALLGCRLRFRWMVVVGLVIASAKPHLSAPVLLFVLLFEPAQRKSVLVAVGMILAFVAFAAWVDGNFFSNYLGSVKTYNSIANNDPKLLIGLESFLRISSLSKLAGQIISVAVLAIVLAIAGALRLRLSSSAANYALALMLVFFSVGIAHSIQGYDVCIYATGIALCSILSFRAQLLLLVPVLVLWRPMILTKLIPSVANAPVADFAWLAILLACTFLACLLLNARSTASA